jgi:hypothetical protein
MDVYVDFMVFWQICEAGVKQHASISWPIGAADSMSNIVRRDGATTYNS